MFCALLIAHTPAQPTFNLELPNVYTTVVCFFSCCIGALIYGIMHHYCSHTSKMKPKQQTVKETLEAKLAALQKLFEPLQADIKTVQTEQKIIATFILRNQITQISDLRENLRGLAHQTEIIIRQHTALSNAIDTCFQNNQNTVPIAVACFWFSKYTEQKKELKEYIAAQSS